MATSLKSRAKRPEYSGSTSFFSNSAGGKKMAYQPDREDGRGDGHPIPPRVKSPRKAESQGLLGRTSGLMAAGVWAARLEVANLLETRCDPLTLVEDIRRGREGAHNLQLDGSVAESVYEPTSPASRAERSRSPLGKYLGGNSQGSI